MPAPPPHLINDEEEIEMPVLSAPHLFNDEEEIVHVVREPEREYALCRLRLPIGIPYDDEWVFDAANASEVTCEECRASACLGYLNQRERSRPK